MIYNTALPTMSCFFLFTDSAIIRKITDNPEHEKPKTIYTGLIIAIPLILIIIVLLVLCCLYRKGRLDACLGTCIQRYVVDGKLLIKLLTFPFVVI